MTKSGTIPDLEFPPETGFRLRGRGMVSKSGRRNRDDSMGLPTISRPLLAWFTWYSRRYLRRHFHSLRLSASGLPPASKLPIVIYSNHASWWDALVCLLLKERFFSERTAFAPIDARMLERYKMFRRLGFFGIEQHTRRGATRFLQVAGTVLQSPENLLFITPQSRFADVRERPVRFRGGLGHLATKVEHALFVPLTIEYVFWEERLPEILTRFGEPVELRRERSCSLEPHDWTKVFEEKLSAAQDALAQESLRRDTGNFQWILRGNAGQGGVYDWWRMFGAALKGKQFNREHGSK